LSGIGKERPGPANTDEGSLARARRVSFAMVGTSKKG
jgi:hypothetical protein